MTPGALAMAAIASGLWRAAERPGYWASLDLPSDASPIAQQPNGPGPRAPNCHSSATPRSRSGHAVEGLLSRTAAAPCHPSDVRRACGHHQDRGIRISQTVDTSIELRTQL